MEKLHLLALLLPLLLGLTLLYIWDIVWLRPERIRKKLRKQGVRGPRPTLFYGNTQEMKRIRQEAVSAQKQDTSNYISTLFPHFLIWRETYGSVFLYSTGAVEILFVSDPGMVKDMSHCTSSELGKPIYIQKSRKPLFGEGILVSNGDIWAYQRKIIAPEFFMEKIKVMIELIVEASVPEDYIVDNCKSIYFGGHETAAVTATWCLMLLATHPAWQDRARAEALEVCGGRTELDVDVLRRLKTITTVIQETLRLYPPASLIVREALTDFKLGALDVPRGTIVQTAIAMLHLDKDVWGQDAGEFRPDRFANGAAAACEPSHMYLPFGHGPRVCAGQNLAMVELKVVLVRLLSRFAFSPSPGYRHAPLFRLTIEPGFGMPLVVTKLP